MACLLYNTGKCLQLLLFNRPNFGVHFSDDILERVVTQNAPILLLVLLIDQINHHFHHHVLLFCLAFSNHQS